MQGDYALSAVDHPLDDARMLATRAKDQIAALSESVRDYLLAHPTPIELATEGTEAVVRVAEPPGYPQEWAAHLGEACGNARAALDHLVYALAFDAGGDPDESRTQFPIFERPGGVRPAARQIPQGRP